MTQSTDKNSQAAPKTQKNKKKGPLRFEAIIPVAIILALGAAYYTFFFDGHLRRAIEFVSTKIHGAEVNIAKLETSFLGGSLLIGGIQVTDKENPSQNLVQIGTTKFQFLWDALLRAKFVINEASIENIMAYSPRKKPGYVQPPEEREKKNEMIAKVENEVLNQAQEQFGGNALGDLAEILGGKDPKDQVKDIKAQLASEKRIKEIEQELDGKEAEWKKKVDELPKGDELKALSEKAKNFKMKSVSSIKELNDLIKEAKSSINKYSSVSKDLKGDINRYKNITSDIDKMVKQDIQSVQNRLKIPDLNLNDFSTQLFGRLFQQKVAQIRKYSEVAKEYLPSKKDSAEQTEKLVARDRHEGRTYTFPKEKGYPRFWLQKAVISSQATKTQFSGDIRGELTNVTSAPRELGRPTILRLQGEFPHQKIYGLQSKIVLDHTGEIPKDTMDLKVASIPVKGRTLSKSSAVTLGFNKASAKTHMQASIIGDQADISWKNDFSKIDYQLEAKNKHVKESFGRILAGIPTVDLLARAKGNWKTLNWNIRSNLGRELSSGVKKEVAYKIDEAKQKVNQMVQEKINGPKKKLQAKYAKLKSKFDNVLNQRKQDLEKGKDNVIAEVKNKQKQQAADKLKGKAKKLLKGIF